MIEAKNPTYAYVGAFVDELARAGVKHAVICPGSRSTPLTLTFAAEERIKKWVLVDERSAAFFALGIAKRSGEPVALVCTSGTAAANFFPAVCEAKEARIPLLVLTADRPPELQAVGGPQTMGQKYLYGEHVKWFTEMPLPEATNTVMRYARFTANRAVAESTRLPLGPVHLNFPFREPLTNTEIPSQPLLPVEKRETQAWDGRPEWYKGPYTKVAETLTRSIEHDYLSDVLFHQEKGVIVVGPFDTKYVPSFYKTISELADYLQYPVLIDPLAKFTARDDVKSDYFIDNYDAFLRTPLAVESLKPKFVLRFGMPPTSKVLNTHLLSDPDCRLWIVDEGSGWLDPTTSAVEIFDMFAGQFACALLQDLQETAKRPKREMSDWLISWQSMSRSTREVIDQEISAFDDLFEGRVFTDLAIVMSSKQALFVGNSMPIRDCDTFFPRSETQTVVLGNRGVNGIDGQISTALGTAAVKNEPTVLVVGDLTFYHDLNGLLAAKKYGLNLTVVVINNDGGGIFSFLPQAEHAPADHFEEYFGTSTGLDFAHATAMYGGTFTRISNWDEFRTAVTTGITTGGLHVVEVPTNRQKNVEMHRHLWRKVSEALANMKGEG